MEKIEVSEEMDGEKDLHGLVVGDVDCRVESFRASRFAEIDGNMESMGEEEGFSETHHEWIKEDPKLCEVSIGKDKSTLLLLAANYDLPKVIEELLAMGECDAMAVDCDGYTALMLAALARDEDVAERMVRTLIPRCVVEGRVAEEISNGMHDVGFAIRNGNIGAAKLIAEARGGGAMSAEGPLSKTNLGKTWLHLALGSTSQSEAMAWVLSLPSAKLMFASKDVDGLTPWDVAMAREDKWPEAVRQLRLAQACWEGDDLLQAVPVEGGAGARPSPRL